MTNIVVFSIVVPAPTINISRLPIDQLYTGTTLILTYTFELNGAVDTEVTGKEILYSQNQYLYLVQTQHLFCSLVHSIHLMEDHTFAIPELSTVQMSSQIYDIIVQRE